VTDHLAPLASWREELAGELAVAEAALEQARAIAEENRAAAPILREQITEIRSAVGRTAAPEGVSPSLTRYIGVLEADLKRLHDAASRAAGTASEQRRVIAELRSAVEHLDRILPSSSAGAPAADA
jgi:hypothetical protein